MRTRLSMAIIGTVVGMLIAGMVGVLHAGTIGGGGTPGYSLTYLATLFLPKTGGTMTGQTVYSAVATDITTGTNEHLVLAPNGTGTVQMSKTAAASSQDDIASMYVSDVDGTKFMFRFYNATSTNATLYPTIAGYTNSTASTHAGVHIFGVAPTTKDATSHSGMVVSTCAKSTDGATGTISALASGGACLTVRNFATDVAHFTYNGAYAPVPLTTTIADNGGGTNATGTITPTAGEHRCTCNDANGCDITLGETNVRDGTQTVITCTTANACNFADTAGVSELAGAFACGQYDSISLTYLSDRWVESSRSNN